ncbi:hypothetical protein [Peristeroidobacter soli]|uniref:hypothetical protein n=1 Tax=Peristeroidobacter soli TaxID=2497877 RepID=UPI00101D9F66|nr:hypothetical protein [Peristeroidobacter soli]
MMKPVGADSIVPDIPPQATPSEPPPAASANAGVLDNRQVDHAPPATARAQWQPVRPNVSFRQAVVAPLGQEHPEHIVNRELSELEADIARLERLGDPRAAEPRDLANSVRKERSLPKAHELLGTLRSKLQEYRSSPEYQVHVDLDEAKRWISDYERWGKKCPASLTRAAKQADACVKNGDVARAGTLLRSIRSERELTQQRRLLKHKHRAAVQALQLEFQRIEPIARSAVQLRPQLKTLLNNYHEAQKAARYHDKASPQDLEQARTRLEQAANDLIVALARELQPQDTDSPKIQTALAPLNNDLYAALELPAQNLVDRARLLEPGNLEQALLHRRLADNGTYQRTATAQTQLIRDARAVLQPGGELNSMVASRPAARDEASYFSRLNAERDSLDAVRKSYLMSAELDDSAETDDEKVLSPAERAAWNDLSRTLARLPGFLRQPVNVGTLLRHEEDALRADPARYTTALQDLALAKQQADRLVRLTAARLEQEIDALDRFADPAEKSNAALQFANQHMHHDGLLPSMRALSVSHQRKLLDAVRGGLPQNDLSTQQRRVQSRLYKSMQLDPAFLHEEKRLREATVATLMAHKPELQRARDEWPSLSPARKLEVIKLIVATHCKVAGFAPPDNIDFRDLDSSTVAAVWDAKSRTLAVNSAAAGLSDFEATMNTIFHENSHNWQFELRAGLNEHPPRITEHSPAHRQAQLFDATMDYYDDGASDQRSAYREQPIEAHAMLAGPRFARALMSALDA